MAWTTPGTAVAGDVLTAAFWNTQVRDNMNAVGVWTSFTPSWTGVTIGNATNTGGYIAAGKTVSYWVKFVLGSTSAVTATPIVTLPVTAKAAQIGCHAGLFEDTGVGYSPIVPRVAGSTIECYAALASSTYVNAATLSATIPFSWNTNDIIWLSGIYESA
jgi:hypothetical protein